MRSLTQLLADLVERRPQAFTGAVSVNREPPLGSRLGDHVGHAKEVERFRATLALSFSLLGRVTAEFDQAGFLGGGVASRIGRNAAGVLPGRLAPRFGIETPSQNHPHTAGPPRLHGSIRFATIQSSSRTHSAGTRWPGAVKSLTLGAFLLRSYFQILCTRKFIRRRLDRFVFRL